MSLSTANTFLLSLPQDQTDSFWQDLITNAVAFEVLDPYELEDDWVEVQKIVTEGLAESERQDMDLLDKLISGYVQKSILSALLDNRYAAKPEDLKMNPERQKEVMHTARLLCRLKEIDEIQADLINLTKQYPDKEFLVGTKAGHLIAPFNGFVEDIIDQFETNHPHAQVEPERPQLDFVQVGNQEALLFNTSDKALVYDFVELHTKEQGHDLQSLSDITVSLSSEKQDIMRAFEHNQINPVRPSKVLLKDLSVLHAILQMKNRLGHLKSNAFTVSDRPALNFAFCSVSPYYLEQFKSIAHKHDIIVEEYEWKREIVLWHQPGGLGAFQQVVQALGTIGPKETDPTKAVSFFFILFFAMAINDALYGLFLILVCGYFLYFRQLKPGFKGMFNLFFLSGIGALGYGALTNSWGGNLFENTGLNHFLEMFQLIHPLNPDSHTPVNSFLRENGGLSPIVAMLGFAVVIGLFHIFTAYFIKINTALKKNDMIEVFSELSWMAFLVSIGVSIAFAITGSSLTPLGIAGILLSALGMFTFNHGKGIAGKVLSGAVKIYELVAFFADMLSYTRLIAIGLTGGIIAEVINLLGNLVYSSFNPVVGFILAAVVLVVGHLFNLVVGLFGAYINPLRLHYVEFLPKFFKGEGRSLRPWDFDFKHLRIQN